MDDLSSDDNFLILSLTKLHNKTYMRLYVTQGFVVINFNVFYEKTFITRNTKTAIIDYFLVVSNCLS